MDREEPQYPRKPELFILFFFFGIFFLKPLNSSSGIQKFLFSSKKRMAVGADFYMDLFFRTLRLECRSASALDHCIENFGVYIFLHLMASKNLFSPIFHKISTLCGNRSRRGWGGEWKLGQRIGPH